MIYEERHTLVEKDAKQRFAAPKPENPIIRYTSSIAEKVAEVTLASESLQKENFDEAIYGNLLSINDLFK